METTTDQKQKIREFLTGLKLDYQATFQPTPQPRAKVEHPQLHWLITLTRGKASMQVPYHEGCAHVKGYQQFHKTKYDQRMHDEAIRLTCETGKLHRRMENIDRWYATDKRQPPPDILDILYCLISDSDVLNYNTYEQWAPELGYEEDSRKGEKIYRQCIEQSLSLKNLIGFQAIETLRELYQDY